LLKIKKIFKKKLIIKKKNKKKRKMDIKTAKFIKNLKIKVDQIPERKFIELYATASTIQIQEISILLLRLKDNWKFDKLNKLEHVTIYNLMQKIANNNPEIIKEILY
jgi:hypothetical protein